MIRWLLHDMMNTALKLMLNWVN